jgi:hypothetical protein
LSGRPQLDWTVSILAPGKQIKMWKDKAERATSWRHQWLRSLPSQWCGRRTGRQPSYSAFTDAFHTGFVRCLCRNYKVPQLSSFFNLDSLNCDMRLFYCQQRRFLKKIKN